MFILFISHSYRMVDNIIYLFFSDEEFGRELAW